MAKRKSLEIEGLSHLTAIPVATRIGPLVCSSVIAPFNPGTREVPEAITDQYANVFHHVKLMLEAASGDWCHVAKMEFWVPDVDRNALDPFWIDAFPDTASRPARHTHVGSAPVVTASFIAYIES